MTSEDQYLSFGRYLRSVRIQTGLSLEEVSWETKIGMENLLRIEKEDLSSLPAEVFVKGFLRSYAKAVGADGDRAVRNYLSSFQVFERAARSEADLKRLSARFWPRMFLSFGVLLCIIAGSIFIMPLLTGQGHKKDPVPSSDVHEEQIKPAQQELIAIEIIGSEETTIPEPENVTREIDEEKDSQDRLSEASELDEKIPIPVPDKQRLSIATIENTWLKIFIDSRNPREYSLKPGDHLDFEASTGFQLLIGNAGGVKMQLNGQYFEVSGKSGQVVSVKIP